VPTHIVDPSFLIVNCTRPGKRSEPFKGWCAVFEVGEYRYVNNMRWVSYR
jgi:hypothetical protein